MRRSGTPGTPAGRPGRSISRPDLSKPESDAALLEAVPAVHLAAGAGLERTLVFLAALAAHDPVAPAGAGIGGGAVVPGGSALAGAALLAAGLAALGLLRQLV